jgi:O-antigen/teichoic acid export membrane protein
LEFPVIDAPMAHHESPVPGDKPRKEGNAWLPGRERMGFWGRKIGQFGAWQLVSQALQLITGFLLVRWMSVEAYAKYGLALGFQNMVGQLVELGFSSAIIALVGQETQNRTVVGRYVRAARSLRNTMLAVVGPLSAIGFIWFAWSHQWSLGSSVVLFLSILALLGFQGWTSCYTPPLLMHQEMSRLYRPAVLLNGAKLLVSFLLHCGSLLTAASLCWLNAITVLFNALLYRSSARPFLQEPEQADPETKREIRRYITPLIPGMIFYAFQGQIQIFLISFFGKTQSIAELTALGRLGQLFIFLASFNAALVVPFIAKVPAAQLGRRYLQAVGLSVVAAALACFSSFYFPSIFLWLLGPKYQGLHYELVLSLIAASLSFVASTLFSMNNARRWVYHWTGISSILGIVMIQAVLIAFMDLSNTRNVLIFSVLTACYPIFIFSATAWIGYRKTVGVPPC